MSARPTPSSAIALVEPDRITVRGQDLCRDLIGEVSFSSYALLLIEGRPPSAEKVRILDACLVAIAEHGLVPSVQAARMTLAAAPEAWQGAVAAGLLGCGSVILGSAEAAGRLLTEILGEADASGLSLAEAADRRLKSLRERRLPVPGFGHPVHRDEDPRAARLLDLARTIGTSGRHVAALDAVAGAVDGIYGRHLPLNVSGAIPAVLLDAGFPAAALKGVPILARTASLIAHLLEESERPIGFALADAAEHSVAYAGPAPGAKPEG